jgi:hypothetical protein
MDRNRATYLKWRFIVPGVLPFVNFLCCLFIVVAITMWISEWRFLGGWRPSDRLFRNEDILYSVASLLAFTRLSHFYKVSMECM